MPYKDIKIIETGLRPGEKLYEELLINSEELQTTENELIFIEKNHRISMDQVRDAINSLNLALERDDSQAVKDSLKYYIKTNRSPDVVNSESACSEEEKRYLNRHEQSPDTETKIASH